MGFSARPASVDIFDVQPGAQALVLVSRFGESSPYET
jgi:hypothetical protein